MITLEALNKLIEYMVDQKQMKAILLEGMTAERSSVLPGFILISMAWSAKAFHATLRTAMAFLKMSIA